MGKGKPHLSPMIENWFASKYLLHKKIALSFSWSVVTSFHKRGRFFYFYFQDNPKDRRSSRISPFFGQPFYFTINFFACGSFHNIAIAKPTIMMTVPK